MSSIERQEDNRKQKKELAEVSKWMVPFHAA